MDDPQYSNASVPQIDTQGKDTVVEVQIDTEEGEVGIAGVGAEKGIDETAEAGMVSFIEIHIAKVLHLITPNGLLTENPLILILLVGFHRLLLPVTTLPLPLLLCMAEETAMIRIETLLIPGLNLEEIQDTYRAGQQLLDTQTAPSHLNLHLVTIHL